MGLKDWSKPCPYCGKKFSTKSSLEPHIKSVHDGQRKKCNICGKVLADMPKHMRVIHGEYRRKPKYPKSSTVPITYNDNFETETHKNDNDCAENSQNFVNIEKSKDDSKCKTIKQEIENEIVDTTSNVFLWYPNEFLEEAKYNKMENVPKQSRKIKKEIKKEPFDQEFFELNPSLEGLDN